MIGYRGEKGKVIITRCSGWRLSSNKDLQSVIKRGREDKVLLKELKRTKFYKER